MSKYCVFIDAGHGGLFPNGTYATSEKDGKKFKHSKGKFHNEGWFYEGVSNRIIADLVSKKLTEEGINVIKVYHPIVDTSRDNRCAIANMYNKTIQSGIFISFHSDASNGTAKGISLWTSVGQTESDKIATKLFQDLQLHLSDVILRKELNPDKDPDYEKNFDVLVNTDMPAVLIENLFFDNYEDACKLINPSYQEAFSTIITNSILDIIK